MVAYSPLAPLNYGTEIDEVMNALPLALADCIPAGFSERYVEVNGVRLRYVVGGKGGAVVLGVMEGTFTKPMPIGDGKTMPPTGKPFKLTMCTVGRWKNGLVDEECLFWDNQSFMKQIGLAQ